jgi:hypothetical protein
MPAYLNEEFWDEVEAELSAADSAGFMEFLDGPVGY